MSARRIFGVPVVRLPRLGETRAVLVEPWLLDDLPGVAAVEIPAGFATDGASIPRALWRLCGHPLAAPRVYAAIVHDWLYSGGAPGMTRAQADAIYRDLLVCYGVPAAVAVVEWAALRLFGARHWRGGE